MFSRLRIRTALEPARPQNRSGELPTRLLAGSNCVDCIRVLFAEVVVTQAAVVATGTQATILKSCGLNRTDTDRCVRAFLGVPCRHAPRGLRA